MNFVFFFLKNKKKKKKNSLQFCVVDFVSVCSVSSCRMAAVHNDGDELYQASLASAVSHSAVDGMS